MVQITVKQHFKQHARTVATATSARITIHHGRYIQPVNYGADEPKRGIRRNMRIYAFGKYGRLTLCILFDSNFS